MVIGYWLLKLIDDNTNIVKIIPKGLQARNVSTQGER